MLEVLDFGFLEIDQLLQVGVYSCDRHQNARGRLIDGTKLLVAYLFNVGKYPLNRGWRCGDAFVTQLLALRWLFVLLSLDLLACIQYVGRVLADSLCSDRAEELVARVSVDRQFVVELALAAPVGPSRIDIHLAVFGWFSIDRHCVLLNQFLLASAVVLFRGLHTGRDDNLSCAINLFLSNYAETPSKSARALEPLKIQTVMQTGTLVAIGSFKKLFLLHPVVPGTPSAHRKGYIDASISEFSASLLSDRAHARLALSRGRPPSADSLGRERRNGYVRLVFLRRR